MRENAGLFDNCLSRENSVKFAMKSQKNFFVVVASVVNTQARYRAFLKSLPGIASGFARVFETFVLRYGTETKVLAA